jgi:hypothetical protein
VLAFAEHVRRDQRDLRPRDVIDLQSFIWILGSDEYAEMLPPERRGLPIAVRPR